MVLCSALFHCDITLLASAAVGGMTKAANIRTQRKTLKAFMSLSRNTTRQLGTVSGLVSARAAGGTFPHVPPCVLHLHVQAFTRAGSTHVSSRS